MQASSLIRRENLECCSQKIRIHLMEVTDPDDHRRLKQRETAALTERHWVRLTRSCNNRCLFCLDAEVHDGRPRAREEIEEDIEEGARRGRRRLILSGGEPTIHPSFRDFVAKGRDAGYERVQVISNGRMFAHPGFLGDAVEAGLGELTISLHGHEPELHDRLVGVPGAFVQTLRAIRAALSQPALIVNVDVVVCGENVLVLDRIIALGLKLGVREFDLLQIQPAGRAASSPGMLYDVVPAKETLERVFALSRRPEVFIWTNRFPVSHLEGFEELIQDPHKMVDEVRGRSEHIAALLSEGTPLRCRGSLCPSCFLEPLCDELHSYAEALHGGSFEEIQIDLIAGAVAAVPERIAADVRRIRITSRDFAAPSNLRAGSLPGREVSLWLEEADGLPDRGPLQVAGLPVVGLGGESTEVLDAALNLGLEEVEVAPALENEGWLSEHGAIRGNRLVVRPAPRATLSECQDREIPPVRLDELLGQTSARVENLPHCLCGGRPVSWSGRAYYPATADLEATMESLVERFAAERYYAKSIRCSRCVAHTRCRGASVQRLRAFGLRILQPIEDVGGRERE